MGQYEPNDSRDVTLKQGHEPGGIERTGPREDEARRQAEQNQKQSQSQGGQSQHQGGGNPDNALDDPPGDPRPEYDQYKVNQPDTLNKQGIAGEGAAQGGYGNARDESGAREDQQADPERDKRRQQAEQADGAGDGYVGETSSDPAERARADAQRPL